MPKPENNIVDSSTDPKKKEGIYNYITFHFKIKYITITLGECNYEDYFEFDMPKTQVQVTETSLQISR